MTKFSLICSGSKVNIKKILNFWLLLSIPVQEVDKLEEFLAPLP